MCCDRTAGMERFVVANKGDKCERQRNRQQGCRHQPKKAAKPETQQESADISIRLSAPGLSQRFGNDKAADDEEQVNARSEPVGRKKPTDGDRPWVKNTKCAINVIKMATARKRSISSMREEAFWVRTGAIWPDLRCNSNFQSSPACFRRLHQQAAC